MNGWLLGSTAFLASAVEAVEALTIVLAVGVTRSWRSALSGAGWALATLAAIVISRPSRIQAMPSAMTSLVKNLDQGSRSILAGIRLRILELSVVATADSAVMLPLRCISARIAPARYPGVFETCRRHCAWRSALQSLQLAL